jgi:hypothetical protein
VLTHEILTAPHLPNGRWGIALRPQHTQRSCRCRKPWRAQLLDVALMDGLGGALSVASREV